MLRDYNISGRLNLMEIPVLLHMLHFWRVILFKTAIFRMFNIKQGLPSGPINSSTLGSAGKY
jgi:hypothetical protein